MKVIENSVPPCLCVLNNVTMSKGWKYGIGLGVVILLLFAGNLLVGSVSIPPADVFRILLGGEGEKASWSFILWESRLPQALTALLCGGALAVCGLMLQTAFKNPLAGPSILGINAGASLGDSSIELSADGPIRPPYAVYFQGGLTWYHAKLGVLMSLQKLHDAGLLPNL